MITLRTFYIFKINKEFKVITKDKPYNLYLALSNIRNMDTSEINLAYLLFDQVCDRNDAKGLNLKIFNQFKDSDYYIKFDNNHLINNYYTEENSKLTINRSYMKVKSSLNNPTFFKILANIPNLFVVDFKSKDYFWLS